MVAGSALEYALSRAQGEGRLVVEVLSVAQGPKGPEARCRRTETIGAESSRSEFTVTKDSSWVRVDGQKELPCRPAVGMRWEAHAVSFMVEGLDAEVRVPAGEFAGCLKVSYLVAAGDAGSGERFYAPGVGLVREECAEESDPFEAGLARLPGMGRRGMTG